MNLATTHQLTHELMEQTIHLRKQKKIKLPDAIIAATAVVYGFIILTRNIKDFHHIDGLDCINPHELF